jgi:hypothetical protein
MDDSLRSPFMPANVVQRVSRFCPAFAGMTLIGDSPGIWLKINIVWRENSDDLVL